MNYLRQSRFAAQQDQGEDVAAGHLAHTYQKQKSPAAVRPPGGYRSVRRSRTFASTISHIFSSKVCSEKPMDMAAGTASSRRG